MLYNPLQGTRRYDNGSQLLSKNIEVNRYMLCACMLC